MRPAKSFFVDMERTIKAADNFSVFKRLFLQPFFNFIFFVIFRKKRSLAKQGFLKCYHFNISWLNIALMPKDHFI